MQASNPDITLSLTLYWQMTTGSIGWCLPDFFCTTTSTDLPLKFLLLQCVMAALPGLHVLLLVGDCELLWLVRGKLAGAERRLCAC